MAILPFLVVDMGVEYPLMMGRNEVFKVVMLTLYRRAHPCMTNIESNSGIGLPNKFLKKLRPA